LTVQHLTTPKEKQTKYSDLEKTESRAPLFILISMILFILKLSLENLNYYAICTESKLSYRN
jgi:hypothetical protein